VVPVIEPLKPILKGWQALPHSPVKSRKTWWRHMRRLLGLSDDVTAYTIRHTVLTYLDSAGVPGAQYSGLAGHVPDTRGTATTTATNYLHYDPANAGELRAALTSFWGQCWSESEQWCADQVRSKPIRGKPISLDRNTGKP
jgi:integrase